MHISSAITTAPRRVSYLGTTLDSLRAAGFGEIIIIEDEACALGPYRNFKRAILRAVELDPECDAVAMFQDDISVASGLREWLESSPWPESPERIGILSPYCAKKHQLRYAGWNRLPLQPEDALPHSGKIVELAFAEFKARTEARPELDYKNIDSVRLVSEYDDHSVILVHFAESKPEWKWFWARECEEGVDISPMQHWAMAFGACAYIMPRENALRIVHECNHPEARSKTDIHVAETCYRLGLSYWIHNPSLVQHHGEVSTLHEFGINDYRRAGNYCCDVSTII